MIPLMRRSWVLALILLLIVAGTVSGAIYWLLAGDGTRVSLERQASAWLGQPVAIAAASPQIFPRIGVRLQDVRVGDPATVTLGTVDVSTGLRALLSRRIEDADVTLANSRIDMPLPFDIPSPTVSGAGTGESGFQIVSIRSIALDDVVIASRAREVRISLDSSFAGSTLTLNRVEATAEGTRVEGSGTVKTSPAIDAELEVTAGQLDLDDLLALAEAFAPAGGQRRASAGDETFGKLVARVSADSVTAAGLTLPQFSTNARVQGGRVSLSSTRFLLFGGRYEGDLDLNVADGTAMTLTSRVSDVDVAQLAAWGGVPDTITGRLSGNASFNGRGTAMSTMLASARGNGTASIVKGEIRRLNLVRTVVLFFGRPAPETQAATDAFERIDATFSLANAIVNADALSLQSRDADIVARGTLSLETKALDGRADLSLSEELSAQAGTDLARYTREGNRIVLPASVGGTLSAPRLSIDAEAAIRRGLRNEVERRMKGLLDRFTIPRQ